MPIQHPETRRTPLPRAAFGLDEGITYLNHAAVGVLPLATRDALRDFVDAHAARGVLGTAPTEMALDGLRERIGVFVGGTGDDVALLRNTGDGATVIAQGFGWRSGDEVLLNRNEFGANAFPWLALRERGVNVRFIDAPRERMTPAVLAREITPRTRIVATSWVTFDDGYRHDLGALAAVAHERGALFVVDAIQALGAFALDAPALGIDALYAGGAKWLMALQGVSFLWLTPALRDRLATPLAGWRSVDDIWNFLAYDQPLAAAARRFEGGTPNFAGALSLATSIDVLAQAPAGALAEHVLTLSQRVRDGARARGWRIAGDAGDDPAVRSGITTVVKDGVDAVALGKRLGGAGIVVTFRPSGLRVAPHGYNDADDVDRFLDGLG